MILKYLGPVKSTGQDDTMEEMQAKIKEAFDGPRYSPDATVTIVLIWKRGILKNLFSHVLNFKSWIKFIHDKITVS